MRAKRRLCCLESARTREPFLLGEGVSCLRREPGCLLHSRREPRAPPLS